MLSGETFFIIDFIIFVIYQPLDQQKEEKF
jgi:hypothetical protein